MVDIIIPVYDNPSYLNRALQSIQDTCSIDKITIYVVNDCAPYPSEQYEKTISNFPNLDIVYTVSPENRGPGAARNIGMRLGHNPYICFLDMDDIYIDDVVKYCDENYDMFITNIERNEVIDYAQKSVIGSIHGLGVKRSMVEKYNVYFSEWRYGGEDTIFRLLSLACSKNCKYCNSTYYLYKVRYDSNFTHRSRPVEFNAVDKHEEDKNGRYNWFGHCLKEIENLTNLDVLMETSRWNDTLLEGFCQMATIDLSLLHLNAYILFAFLIKKYINIQKVSCLNTHGIMQYIPTLVFIQKFFTLTENNILIFNQVKTAEHKKTYHDFLTQYEQYLPKAIVDNFQSILPKYFNVNHLLTMIQDYEYEVSFTC